MREAAGGDRVAFERLVERHQAAVYRFVRTLAAERGPAEDALQETFLAAWRSAAGFRGGSLRSWLLAIARHALYRQHRRRAGEPERHESLESLGERAGWGAPPDPAALALRRERRERLQAALASLAAADREILLLRDAEGLSGEDTAAALGLGLAAMKSRLHRARLRFAAELRRGGSDEG